MSAISRIDGAGRERVRPARQVLLDDVVLGRAREHVRRDPVLLRRDDVERQQPRRRRVDRHRRVHLVERDAVQQRVHVALVRDRHADLADLAARELVVGVVAGLRRQVEGDREPGLALGQVAAGTARWTASRSNGRRRCASSTGGRAVRDGAPCWVSSQRVRAIDVKHLGREHVICCWEVDGVLVDPGPQSCEDTLLAALGDAASRRRLLLTHIHFDHAGATGALVRRWPDLPVYVHERGAPHLADPEKLVASAARLYGGEEGLARLWGEVVPVPEENLKVLDRRRDASRAPSASSTRPATPPTTSATCTRRAGRRSSATSPACASRPADVHARADAAAGHRRRDVGGVARPRSPAGSRRRSR